MNTKTKPLTGRIEDIVPSQLANRIHLDPVAIQGLIRYIHIPSIRIESFLILFPDFTRRFYCQGAWG